MTVREVSAELPSVAADAEQGKTVKAITSESISAVNTLYFFIIMPPFSYLTFTLFFMDQGP